MIVEVEVTVSAKTFQTNNTVSRNEVTVNNTVVRNEFEDNVVTQFPGADLGIFDETFDSTFN